MIAILKTLHIAALVIWCAALVCLPILLSLHRQIAADPAANAVQRNYTRFRKLTHVTYTAVATPAAVIAIAVGTVLIFVAQVFEVWLLAKLTCVVGMVLAHIWLGHLIVQSSEREVDWRMPWPALALLLALPSILGVLWFVLAKPDLTQMVQSLPAWLHSPLKLDWAQLLGNWLPAQEDLP